ncbi:MAG: NADH:ubiquinone reductase (Na(+)-transporting) subunit B [Prevotellaceae bacterium]|jgi:Na+-transporting NADH:ubiquinone oxidoreductase subunit B|nr:NADH:ubiquinone reductase (Na(+)-transporting) subunit B [Prevotellaceae bacterium]
MNALRKFVDSVKPNFEKGGKLHFLHSTFDAFETFLFVPNTVSVKGAHIRDSIDMKRTMIVVCTALLPALLFGIWNVGFQHFLSINQEVGFWGVFGFGLGKVLPMIVVSYVVGLGIEFAAAQIRGHEVNEGFLVTGLLIPMVMPADLPLWMLALATAFAVVIGKEVFGGTGMNIFNPALLARAFVFFSYPSFISGDKIWIAGLTKGEGVVDGFSGATPLAKAMLEQLPFSAMETQNMILGTIPGAIGETSKLAILLGAALLIFTGIASWRIMLSVVAGGYLTGLLFNAVGGNAYMDMPAYYHLLMGGFAFGAVFMATDPVTASQTNRGKWIYGFIIGVMAVVIRVLNPAYPEGMMLAILLMNAFAPLIDYYVVQGNIKRREKRALLKVQSS